MIKNISLTLKAILENNHVRISIKSSSDPMFSWSGKQIEINSLSNNCNQIVETLNKSRRQEYADEIFNDLKGMGYALADDLLTADLKDLLRKTQAESIVLELDEKLVHIPWEHICIDDMLLCQKFSMGRLIETRQKIFNTDTREIKIPYNIWVIVNPQFDLDNADSEGNTICRLMDQMNYLHKKEIIKASLNTDIRTDSFKARIRHYDFIHFAGHGLFQNDQPDECGLKLSQGTITTSDIKAMEGSGAMPLMIFSNACQSARAFEIKHMPFSLAHSFIRSGVRHYIGTFWKIFDEPGSQFAKIFYQKLLAGESIGSALKKARIDCSKDYTPDVWASYVLYGNPDICYFSDNTKFDDPQTKNTKPALKSLKSRGNNENLITENQLNSQYPQETNQETSQKNFPFNHQFNPQYQQGIKQNNFPFKWGFAALCCVLALFIFFYISEIFQNKTEISFEMLKILKSAENDRRIRISRLLEKIKKQIKSPELSSVKITDNWTSTLLTLGIYFDPEDQFKNRGLEKKFALMAGQYLKTQTRLILLNRMNREIILEELIQGSSELIDPKNRMIPRLYPVRLVLFVEIHSSIKSNKYLSLSLIDTQTEKWIFNHWEKIHENKLPMESLEKIKMLLLNNYPLRGMISKIDGDMIKLNIGFDHGVRVHQIFSTSSYSCQLSIIEVNEFESIAKFTKPECLPIKEKRVFLEKE